ncbi:MAG: DUF951 domain-containing protein [Clostridia bacterium]|nr:DUF951 domain-containing protein [Clostridia bacterium]MBR2927252.1 DUF951 domain-containing protein [Clostridia bacterium]
MPLHVGDIIQLKKPHPCGERQFRILRVGSLVRVVCQGCGRDMNVDRIKLEKAIQRVITQDSQKDEKGTEQ